MSQVQNLTVSALAAGDPANWWYFAAIGCIAALVVVLNIFFRDKH